MSNPNWVEVAVKLKESGVSWTKLPDEVCNATGERHGYDKVRSAVRRRVPSEPFKEEVSDPKDRILDLLLTSPRSLQELSEEVDKSEGTVLALIDELNKEYNISDYDGNYHLWKIEMEENRVHKENVTGRVFRFALCGDSQLCSKYQQLTYLNKFYDRCEMLGIETVFHTGDMIDGEDLYKGHRYEIFKVGSDAQVDYALESYPRRSGITTKFITGNHDLCYYKRQGQDIGKIMERERDDLVYLGQLAAWVEISPGVWLYMLHPDGGGAYAISYKPQKIAASFFGGEKPNLMALGHWHQTETLFERNIHIVQTGCFQSQTPYLKRKALMPKIAGYICEAIIEDGGIAELTTTLVPYYEPIAEDY